MSVPSKDGQVSAQTDACSILTEDEIALIEQKVMEIDVAAEAILSVMRKIRKQNKAIDDELNDAKHIKDWKEVLDDNNAT